MKFKKRKVRKVTALDRLYDRVDEVSGRFNNSWGQNSGDAFDEGMMWGRKIERAWMRQRKAKKSSRAKKKKRRR
jgi:hypothetical protein